MMQCLPVFVVFYDPVRETIQYQPVQVEKELGYPVADNPDFQELLHPDDRPHFWHRIGSLLAEPIDTAAEVLRLLCSNGAYRTYQARFRKVRQTDGSTVFPVVLDAVTEDASLEQRRFTRDQSEELLSYGIYEFDGATGTGWWSEGLYRLFGYEEERPPVTYAFYLSHIDPESYEETVGKIQEAVSNRTAYTLEYTIITRHGLKKHIQITGHKLYDREGRPGKDIGLIRDLTSQRLNETVIRKYIGELERSNKELEEFAYIASHDLQEPLRKISTFSSRLMSRPALQKDANSNEYLDRIMASVENMRVLIDNLLEFSRVSRKKDIFTEVALDAVLQQTLQDLELKIDETGAHITAPALPVIHGSASQLKQLFVNLLENAIKFRKTDSVPEIAISCAFIGEKEREENNLPADRSYYKIIFEDNGIGFEQQYAARIFQVFHRLHGKAEYPGSGIGLAICKKIVEHHGGLISASNLPGIGARFSVILPGDDDTGDAHGPHDPVVPTVMAVP